MEAKSTTIQLWPPTRSGIATLVGVGGSVLGLWFSFGEPLLQQINDNSSAIAFIERRIRIMENSASVHVNHMTTLSDKINATQTSVKSVEEKHLSRLYDSIADTADSMDLIFKHLPDLRQRMVRVEARVSALWVMPFDDETDHPGRETK